MKVQRQTHCRVENPGRYIYIYKKKKNENRKYNHEKEIASTINIQIKEFHQVYQPHHILDVYINTLSCLGIFKI